MNSRARAAVYPAPNQPFEIREFPLRNVAAGELLVRVTMSSICRSDIHSWQGKRPNPCPGLLGHEIIGRIEQLGSDITHDLRGTPLEIGDRSTWTEFFHAGTDYYDAIHNLPQKALGLRKYGHESADMEPHLLGGFAEYCYVMPGTGILKLSDQLTDEEAVPLNCAAATMASVCEASHIGLGDTVVVQGLGLLGIYGVAMACARGATRVVGIDTVDARLDTARHFGATCSLNAADLSEQDLIEAVREQTRPDGADVVLEVCGNAAVIPAGIQMLRRGGRYTTAGLVSPGATVTFDANLLVQRLVTLKGIHNYHPRHLLQAHDFVLSAQGRFPFGDLIEARFPLEQINDAFQQAADRIVLRACVTP
ncbi:MAG: zinc-binding dehydrogenase [Planctomycetota bacterium]|nr:zinc-binding dehydrogenase [Planctomycetota bacterium]